MLGVGGTLEEATFKMKKRPHFKVGGALGFGEELLQTLDEVRHSFGIVGGNSV